MADTPETVESTNEPSLVDQVLQNEELVAQLKEKLLGDVEPSTRE